MNSVERLVHIVMQELRNMLAEKEKQVREREGQLEEKERQLAAILNSWGWKITEPLRRVLNLLQKMSR